MKYLLLLCLLFLPQLAKSQITLGTLPDEPAPTVASVLAQLPLDGEALRVVSYQDLAGLLEALNSGAIDAALLEQPMALLPGIARITELYPSVLHMLYTGASTPEGLDELITSGSVYAGAPGGLGQRLLKALEVDYALRADSVQISDSVLSGDPDVYFIFGGLLSADALARLPEHKLWSLDSAEQLMHGSVAESLMLRYPNLRPFVLPAELYPTLGREAAVTVAVSTLLVVAEELEEDRAYALAQLAERARPLIGSVYPLAGLPHLRTPAETGAMLPLHEGARRFLERNEPSVLERYAEVLALGFSLIIALGSASVAWERRRRQTRKDRLDRYFKAVMDARPDQLSDSAAVADAQHKIRAIQSEVLELVIAERIDADGALVAFLSLSNQALNETVEASG